MPDATVLVNDQAVDGWRLRAADRLTVGSTTLDVLEFDSEADVPTDVRTPPDVARPEDVAALEALPGARGRCRAR